MKIIRFNSKETYLAYRSAWKAEYKKLSTEIRTLRLGDRFHQRSRHPLLALSPAEHRYVAGAGALCESPEFDSAVAAFHRHRRSARATEMLVDLKEAKAEAQRQYLASKAATLPGPRDASH
jgi:hypothetical protein